jgi:poly(3-hydroxybutyrate) depolymerase
MMIRRLVCVFLLAALAGAQELKTATGHRMQYYLSLPRGWTAGRSWPVVVSIESANREFQSNAAEFAKARGERPFIIVVPLVLTGGGPRFREVPSYRYSDAVWAEIERVDAFAFDEAGIAAMIADVKRLYGGEDRYFLTGWEAGGHTVWAMMFRHPEQMRGVAPVSTNYLGRWMTPESFSSSPARTALPVKVFQSSQVPSKYFAQQTVTAMELAKAHGFANLSTSQVDKPHGALAEEVMSFFAQVAGR